MPKRASPPPEQPEPEPQLEPPSDEQLNAMARSSGFSGVARSVCEETDPEDARGPPGTAAFRPSHLHGGPQGYTALSQQLVDGSMLLVRGGLWRVMKGLISHLARALFVIEVDAVWA
ncbi:MAG: hypothetical protein J3K34DRAFT_397567, partial [Monoraphidium minutum]